MAGTRRLEIVIAGDAKGALGAFAQTEAGAGGLGAKLSKLGPIAAAAGLAVAAGVAGAGVALFKIGESFDEQYDKIRVGTGAVGAELDGLKDTFKAVVSDVPASFDDAGTAITMLVQKFGAAEPAVEGLAAQFLELSRITKTDLSANLKAGTDAITNWNIEAGAAPDQLDKIFRASQLSGVSFADLASQLADTGLVLRGLGFNMDQATTVLAGLGKAGVDVGDVMPALTKTLKAAAEAGKDAGTVYKETLRAIKDAPDAWTASAKAIEVFGAKAGPKFAQLIREGKFAFDELGESIAEGSETILQAGKDTQDFGEKWTLLKNRLMVALEPLAMKVFDEVGKTMDRLGPVVENVARAFSEEGLSGALRVVAGYFNNLDGSTKAIIIGIAAVGLALWAVFAPVSLIVVGLAALVAGLVYAYTEFDAFRAVVDRVASDLVTVFGGIQTAVGVLLLVWSDAWPRMQRATEIVSVAVRDVSAGVSEFLTAVAPLMDALRAGWELNWQAMSGALRDAWSTISPILSAISSAIQGVLDMLDRLPRGNASGGVTIPTPFGDIGIPGFASGGMIPGPLGSPQLVVAHGGERVFTPAQQNAGGGTNIYLTVNAGMGTDGPQVGRQIIGLLEKATASGVRPGVKTLAAFRS